MPKVVQPLTESAIKKLKIGQKLSDGRVRGLYVQRLTEEVCVFRANYSTEHGRTQKTLGNAPPLTLSEARAMAMQVLGLIGRGEDPAPIIAPQKGVVAPSEGKAPLFQVGVDEYMEARRSVWSDKTYHQNFARINNNLTPTFYNVHLDKISPIDAFEAVKAVHSKGKTDMALRVYQLARDLFRFFVFRGYLQRNPVDGFKFKDVGKVDRGHHAAIIDAGEYAIFLKTVRDNIASDTTRHAFLISAHVFLRSSELRLAEWSEIDFDKKMWTVPKKRMKNKKLDHFVPLTDEVLELLKAQKVASAGSKYLFPSYDKSVPVSFGLFPETIKSIGYGGKATQHGFRHSFRTIGREVLRFNPTLQEVQMSHANKNAVEAAYDRSSLIEERREMLEKWSKYISGLMAA